MVQTGGAVKKILGSGYAPDITNADEMMEKTSFLFSISHGYTDVENLLIVPENTFLIHTALSGYFAYIGIKYRIEEFGTMNLDKLLTSEAFPGSPEEQKASYKAALFKNFFEGNMDLYKFYNGVQIFCPGDLVQDNILSYSHEFESRLWGKGVYEFPMTAEESKKFTIQMKPGALFSEDHPIYIVLTQKDTNPELAAAYRDAAPIAKYTEWLDRLSVTKEIDVFNTIFRENFDGNYTKPATTGDFVGKTLREVYPMIFNNLVMFDSIFKKLAYTHEKNLLITQGLFPLAKDNIRLSDLVSAVKAPGEKKYRFILFSGCRSPIGVAGKDAPNALQNFPTHRTIPAGELPKRVFSRRLSLAAKERNDMCAYGLAPPFNLLKVMNILNNKMRLKALSDITRFVASYGIYTPEGEFYNEPLSILVNYPAFCVYELGKDMYKFISRITLTTIAKFVNALIKPSLFLESKVPDYQASIEYSKELLEAYRETFARFLLELRRNDPNIDRKTVAPGVHILLKAEVPEIRFPLNTGFKKMTAKMLEQEREWLDEYDARDRKEQEKRNLLKAWNDVRNPKNKFDLNDFYAKGAFISLDISDFMDGIKRAIDILEDKLKKAETLKDQLGAEMAVVAALKKDKASKFKDTSSVLTVLQNVPKFAEQVRLVKEIMEMYADLPEAKADIDRAKRRLDEIEFAQKEYDRLLKIFNKRVGEIMIALKEEAYPGLQRMRMKKVAANLGRRLAPSSAASRAIREANEARTRKNSAARKAAYLQNKVIQGPLGKLGAFWKGFKTRKNVAKLREEAAAAAAEESARRKLSAARKIQSRWRTLRAARNAAREAETAARTAARRARQLETLSRARAEATRRRGLSSAERRAENEAKAASKLATKAAREAATVARREAKEAEKAAATAATKAARNASTAARREAKEAEKAASKAARNLTKKKKAANVAGAGNE